MKILFLSNRLPHQEVASGHRVIYHRIRHLVDAGHQVGLASFFTPDDEKYIPDVQAMVSHLTVIPAGKRNLAVRMFRDYLSAKMPAIFWKNYSPDMMRAIGDMVHEYKYDVVLAEFSEMGMYLYRNPFLSAVRKVVSCHRCLSTAFEKYAETPGLAPALRLKSAIQVRGLRKYEFEMYRSMDRVLTLTSEDRVTLLKFAPDLRVTQVAPGVDLNYLSQPTTPPISDPVILMTGFYSDKGNNDAALWFGREVWPKIVEKYPDIHFMIVGPNPGADLHKLARTQERVVVTGAVEDLRPYLSHARIFVNPIRLGSGLRIKILEAMASEVPVVSTSLGVHGIRAKTGDNCFVADTPGLIRKDIEWLLEDASLADTMGLRGRRMVEKHYDIEKNVKRLEQVLQEVVDL